MKVAKTRHYYYEGENLKALKATSQAGKDIRVWNMRRDAKDKFKGYFGWWVKDQREAAMRVIESVYPILADGTLDQVFDYKGKN